MLKSKCLLVMLAWDLKCYCILIIWKILKILLKNYDKIFYPTLYYSKSANFQNANSYFLMFVLIIKITDDFTMKFMNVKNFKLFKNK